MIQDKMTGLNESRQNDGRQNDCRQKTVDKKL